MSRRDDGGPAFARPGYEDRSSGSMSDGDRVIDHEDGMSLRDYFAAKAMAGWMATYGNDVPATKLGDQGAMAVAQLAYRIADAMLHARAIVPFDKSDEAAR